MNIESKSLQVELSLRQEAEKRLKAGEGKTDPIIGDSLQLVHELRVRQIELQQQNESLHEARLLAESSLASYTELYERSPVGYLTLDREGRIDRANVAALALLRVSPGRLGEQRLSAVVADDSIAALDAFLAGLFGNDGASRCEVALRPGDGRSDSGVVLLEGRVEASGRSGIVALIDVTERTRAHDGLRRAAEAAKRANVAKSRFLAAASHDLRQPLQALYLITSVMARKTEDNTIRPLLVEMERALGGMSSMLNTLLDINHLDAGIVAYTPVDFAISPLLKRLAQDFAFQAGAANDVLRLVDSTQSVQSDPKLLEQILRNLLTNAFKYTHDGRVLLGCRRQGGHVRIEVWDDGIGIAEDQFDSIFEAFHQVDNPHRLRSRGMGLGLAIVKRQAALLGHPIGVRSRPGKGSLFWIEVPRGGDLTTISESVPSSDSGAFAPIRYRTVLVVEDDPSIRAMLEQLFTAEGCTVIRAETGREALALGSDPFDLVITDYTLPDGITGLDVLSRLRKEHASLPAILLTGDIETDTVRRIATEPDCIHLFKPAKTTDILRAAGAFLARSVHHLPPATGEAAASTVHVIDDDPLVCKAMAALLHDDSRDVFFYPNAETFLRTYTPGREGCLIVDAVMPGMGGIALIRHLRGLGDPIPAIVTTGHSDMPMAVAAMKAGAEDFIAKPIDPEEMLAAVGRAFKLGRDVAAENDRRLDAARRIASLTPRETQVLGLMLTGLSNKIIAYKMGISRRTVENHRAAIMSKTGSKSQIDLYRIALLSSG